MPHDQDEAVASEPQGTMTRYAMIAAVLLLVGGVVAGQWFNRAGSGPSPVPAGATSDATAGSPMILKFWAPWCGPCRVYAPIFEEVTAKYAGRLRVLEVNVDNDKQLAAQYQIRSIPATVVLNGADVEVDRVTGALNAESLERLIASSTGLQP